MAIKERDRSFRELGNLPIAYSIVSTPTDIVFDEGVINERGKNNEKDFIVAN